MKKWVYILIAVSAGLFVGFVNGFLGAGGGMLLVPILMYLLNGQTKIAHSTAVLVILPISLISGIVYIIKGIVDWEILLPVAIGTLVGGIIGTFLMKKLKNDVINFIFWIVMIGAGLFVVFG